jgi:hypothetical protein
LLLNTVNRGLCAVPDTLCRICAFILILLSNFLVIISQVYVNYLPADLPALRRSISPANLTPFPLYGSGLRNERIFAQT